MKKRASKRATRSNAVVASKRRQASKSSPTKRAKAKTKRAQSATKLRAMMMRRAQARMRRAQSATKFRVMMMKRAQVRANRLSTSIAKVDAAKVPFIRQLQYGDATTYRTLIDSYVTGSKVDKLGDW